MFKLFHVFNNTRTAPVFDTANFNNEFYPAIIVAILMCVITYLAYLNATKDATIFHLKAHYNDICTRKVQVIEALLEENEYLRNGTYATTNTDTTLEVTVPMEIREQTESDDGDFIHIE